MVSPLILAGLASFPIGAGFGAGYGFGIRLGFEQFYPAFMKGVDVLGSLGGSGSATFDMGAAMGYDIGFEKEQTEKNSVATRAETQKYATVDPYPTPSIIDDKPIAGWGVTSDSVKWATNLPSATVERYRPEGSLQPSDRMKYLRMLEIEKLLNQAKKAKTPEQKKLWWADYDNAVDAYAKQGFVSPSTYDGYSYDAKYYKPLS